MPRSGARDPHCGRHINPRPPLLPQSLLQGACARLARDSTVPPAEGAAQRGFLTAVVEDCCADRPQAHEQTLERYGGFVFRRTTVDTVLQDHPAWWAALQQLEELGGVAAAPPQQPAGAA